MNIQLPIESVVSLVDIDLGKRTDVSYRQDVFSTPPKISFTISFTNLEAAPWRIYIHPLADSTEITFPLYFQASDVLPTPLPGGGTMEILSEEPPVYDDPIEKAKYDVCHSVWLELQLQEGLHANSTLEQRSSDIQHRGRGGRPSFQEDLWAWEQVVNRDRQKTEVYQEWYEKIQDNPQRTNMVDPKRQFNRITKPKWGNKPGQNI
jgi:hypothetical protein